MRKETLWQKHKKAMLITCGILLGGAAVSAIAVACWKNGKTLEKLIERASLTELKEARQLVQTDYNNPNLDKEYRIKQGEMLDLFDKIIRKKEWNGQEPIGPAYHREHGYRLYKN